MFRDLRGERRSIFGIGSLLCLVLAATPAAKAQAGGGLRMHVIARVGPSPRPSDSTVYDSLLGATLDSGTRAAFLADRLSQALADTLRKALSSLQLSREIAVTKWQGTALEDLPALDYLLLADVRINDQKTLRINTSITQPEAVQFRQPNPLRGGDPQFEAAWGTLGLLNADPGRVRAVLNQLTDSLISGVFDPVFQWLVNSSIRLRVVVGRIVYEGRSPSVGRLAGMLHRIVVNELSKSDAIMVQSDTVTGDELTTGANYVVSGGYTEVGAQVRVDLHAMVQRPLRRVLAGQFAVADTGDVQQLSVGVAQAVNGIKRAMASDFRRSSRTIAFYSTGPERVFAARAPPRVDSAAVRAIVRAMAQKLSLLTTVSGGDLRLEVITAAEVGTSSTDPPTILADLRADYLVMVRYADMGERVRVSADLHGYVAEAPAIGTLLHQGDVDRTELGVVVDSTILKLAKKLELVGRGGRTDSPPATDSERLAVIRRLRLPALVKTKEIGYRLGVVLGRASPNLYFGRQSGTYLEMFFSAMLPFQIFSRPGGQFDTAVEVLWGHDLGGNLSLNGAWGSNLFANLRVILTPWQYSRTSFNAAIGGGLGMQSLRYNFHPGDPDFSGDEPYRELGFSLAANVFGQIDFGFLFGTTVDIVMRWVPSIGRTVDTFVDAPLTGFTPGNGPTGKLGAAYIMGGLKLRLL